MKHQTAIRTRLVAAMLVAVAVIGLSALSVHAPTQNQNSLARSLKSIQTDKATMFYAKGGPGCAWFVEAFLPGNSDSKAATENLKSIAAAGPDCAWFVEAVLPGTSDSKAATENLKSIAAPL